MLLHLACIENITNYLHRWGWTRHSDLVQPPWRRRSSYSDAFCDPDTQPGFLWLLSRSLGRLRLCLKQTKRKIYFCKHNYHTGCWWGKLRERCHLGDPGVHERIILNWIFGKLDGGHGLDWSGSGYGQAAGCFECGNEPLVSIKCGWFLD